MSDIDDKIKELEAQLKVLKELNEKDRSRTLIPEPLLPVEYPFPPRPLLNTDPRFLPHHMGCKCYFCTPHCYSY